MTTAAMTSTPAAVAPTMSRVFLRMRQLVLPPISWSPTSRPSPTPSIESMSLSFELVLGSRASAERTLALFADECLRLLSSGSSRRDSLDENGLSARRIEDVSASACRFSRRSSLKAGEPAREEGNMASVGGSTSSTRWYALGSAVELRESARNVGC